MPVRADAPRTQRRLAPSERRQILIHAALDCLSRLGPHGAGVREICARAGVSPGLLCHYFDGKDDLIVEAYRALTDEYHEQLQRVLADSSQPAETRLRAFFDAYFSNRTTGRDRAGTYLAYWTLGRTNPTIRRIQRSAYRKLRKLLASVLEELAADRAARIDADRVASSLIALLDGFWLDMCIDPTRFSRAKARADCWKWLDTFIQGSRSRRGQR